jgi:hypothetical protein
MDYGNGGAEMSKTTSRLLVIFMPWNQVAHSSGSDKRFFIKLSAGLGICNYYLFLSRVLSFSPVPVAHFS